MPGRILNRKDVAEVFGCSLPTVDVWIGEGMPAVKQGAKGSPWEFDSVAVHQWLVKKAKATRRTRANRFGEGGETPEQPEGESGEEAKARKARADASLSELELAEALKLVAPVAVIAKTLSDEISKARARILAIPVKLRPTADMCASSPERAKRVVAEVDKLIREALEEIKSGGGGQ